jgi:hypothetical protein
MLSSHTRQCCWQKFLQQQAAVRAQQLSVAAAVPLMLSCPQQHWQLPAVLQQQAAVRGMWRLVAVRLMLRCTQQHRQLLVMLQQQQAAVWGCWLLAAVRLMQHCPQQQQKPRAVPQQQAALQGLRLSAAAAMCLMLRW